jgi:hypothetical protein
MLIPQPGTPYLVLISLYWYIWTGSFGFFFLLTRLEYPPSLYAAVWTELTAILNSISYYLEFVARFIYYRYVWLTLLKKLQKMVLWEELSGVWKLAGMFECFIESLLIYYHIVQFHLHHNRSSCSKTNKQSNSWKTLDNAIMILTFLTFYN